MENKLRCAVIGIGNMGKNHVRTYSEIPGIDLVAVADLDEKLGEAAAQSYGLSYYRDYQEMLKKESLDIVSICVPTSFHLEVAKRCIDAGAHILLEKPIAMTVEEGKKILQHAHKKKIIVLVGHIERFNPAVRKVKELIEKKELGEVIAITARRVGGFPPQIKDANISIDSAIHDIDIANFLLDDLPHDIQMHQRRNHIKKREDSVEFFLQYKKACAYLQANWITPVKIRKLTITGTEGYLEMDYVTQQIEFYKSHYEKFKEGSGAFSDYILRFSEPDLHSIAVAKKEPLKEEILYLVENVKKKKEINCQYSIDALKIALHKK